MTTISKPTNGEEAYAQVRGLLIAQQKNLKDWCEDNGTHQGNLKDAFYGSWNGAKAKSLVNKACKDAGVDYQVAA